MTFDSDVFITQLRHVAINAADCLGDLKPTQRKRLQLYAALLVEQIELFEMEEEQDATPAEVQP